MTKPTVLIIADEVEFSRMLIGRWQTERAVPAFTVVCSNVWQGTTGEYDVAIVGPVATADFHPMLTALDAAGANRPAICVCPDQAAVQYVRHACPRILALRQDENWLESLVLLAAEALRRAELATRVRQAEQTAAACHRNATLGRYMLEMRHSLNNALTSVLGNAELLLLEPGTLSSDVRDQIETIHTMALRMHEILQRFSSLEAEMKVAEKQSHCETQPRVQHYAAGS